MCSFQVLIISYSCGTMQIRIDLISQFAYIVVESLLIEGKIYTFFFSSQKPMERSWQFFFLFFFVFTSFPTKLIVLLSHHIQYVPKGTYFLF